MTRKDREMIALLIAHVCDGIIFIGAFLSSQDTKEFQGVHEKVARWYAETEKLGKKTKAWIDNDGGE